MMSAISQRLLTTLILILSCFLSGCGFLLQGEMKLAPPLQKLYLQTADPYGYFSRILKQYLQMSHVQIVPSPNEANTTLVILQDTTSQELLSVSGTQQTRQYNLRVTVSFEINDTKGRVLVPPQTLSETRIITVQSNQILGSSNEANLYYQQMRRSLAYAVMNRIASKEITLMVESAFKNADPKITP